VTKSEGLSGGYLYGLLADGSRKFRYRNRVRALLGLPRSEGVKVSFGSILSNMMNFTYTHPQFTRGFYLPDETPDQPARGMTDIEDEFINLPNVSEQKAHFSERETDQSLYNAESTTADEKHRIHQSTRLSELIQEPKQAEMSSQVPSPSRVSPVNLPNVVASKAIADMPRITERYELEVPGLPKNETTRPAEIQLPSRSGNEDAVHIQVESSGNLPLIASSPASVTSRQTPSSLMPYESTRPHIRPHAKHIQSLERTEENLEEQGHNIESPQFPAVKMQPRNRAESPKPTLSSTESESKFSQAPVGSQNDVPTPAPQVTVLWRGIESKPKNYAFWERRHLSHYRLRLLR
jgi:hypothetical protein